MQLAALGYGLHTVYIARPMAMVFEVERFRLVTANNVLVEELPKALPEFRELSLTGPGLLGPPAAGRRRAQRRDVHGRRRHRHRPAPDLLAAVRADRAAALARSRPLGMLLEQYPQPTDDPRRT